MIESPSGLLLPPRSGGLIVASYNIHKGVGSDLRRDPARTLAVLREIDADLVALQEVDRRFGDRAGVLDLARLADETGLEPVALDRSLGARAAGWHGNLLLVRKARIEGAEALTLPGLEPRGAIVADLRIGDRPLRVIAAHLGLVRRSRLAQARRLAAEIGGLDDRPTLMMGDLNEWRAGPGGGLMPLQAGPGAQLRPVAALPSFPARCAALPLDRVLGCDRATVTERRLHASPLRARLLAYRPNGAVRFQPPAQEIIQLPDFLAGHLLARWVNGRALVKRLRSKALR